LRCTSRFENRARRDGHRRIAGVDEAGRGAWFGPVVAAAVILDPERPVRGLKDSKLLDPETRESLARQIRARAWAWRVAAVDAGRIDLWNILQASREAMRRAVLGLALRPDLLLIDAVNIDVPIPQRAIIHGDALSVSIAAASILAKVERDSLMQGWDAVFPQYCLGRNKGYGTPEHYAGLESGGVTPLHRRSYAPVAERALFPSVADPDTDQLPLPLDLRCGARG
jgi:ribonuclease HII